MPSDVPCLGTETCPDLSKVKWLWPACSQRDAPLPQPRLGGEHAVLNAALPSTFQLYAQSNSPTRLGLIEPKPLPGFPFPRPADGPRWVSTGFLSLLNYHHRPSHCEAWFSLWDTQGTGAPSQPTHSTVLFRIQGQVGKIGSPHLLLSVQCSGTGTQLRL